MLAHDRNQQQQLPAEGMVINPYKTSKIPIALTIFAYAFFCFSGFSCHSFRASSRIDMVGNSNQDGSFNYGIWKYQDLNGGKCIRYKNSKQTIDDYDTNNFIELRTVNARQKLARAVSVMGAILGIAIIVFLMFFVGNSDYIQRNLVDGISVIMLFMVVFSCALMANLGAVVCSDLDFFDCRVNGPGYLSWGSALLWMSVSFWIIPKTLPGTNGDNNNPNINEQQQPSQQSMSNGGDRFGRGGASSSLPSDERDEEDEYDNAVGVGGGDQEMAILPPRRKVVERVQNADGTETETITRTYYRSNGNKVVEKTKTTTKLPTPEVAPPDDEDQPAEAVVDDGNNEPEIDLEEQRMPDDEADEAEDKSNKVTSVVVPVMVADNGVDDEPEIDLEQATTSTMKPPIMDTSIEKIPPESTSDSNNDASQPSPSAVDDEPEIDLLGEEAQQSDHVPVATTAAASSDEKNKTGSPFDEE